MSPSRRELERFEEGLGELLEEQASSTGRSTLDRYADDPVAFIREVLGGSPWKRQREIVRAVLGQPQVTVRSCHAAGKDWLAARLALWWCYARQGLVVLTGPTATQVEEILMRGEVREAFRRASLPGELHVRALRPGGEGRAGILAKTATGVSALTGFHDARVLFCITEAQDPEIEHAWDAAFACTTGADDRILTLGNPTRRTGRFYQAHRPKSDWTSVKIAASDIPNVRKGETVLPGLLTGEGVERFAAEYGEDSGFYQSRIRAEFPKDTEEGLFHRSWLEAAAERHEIGPRKEDVAGSDLVAALDPARRGPDASVLALRRGPVLKELVVWDRRMDTTELVEKVKSTIHQWGFRPRRRARPKPGFEAGHSGSPTGRVIVDEVGVGGGVLDQLAEFGYETVGFKGAERAKSGDRFANRRAEGYWKLRERLETGEVALPEEEKLVEELLAVRWQPSRRGLIQIERKEKLRNRIGRSPDRADAVVMAFAAPRPRAPESVEPVHW